MELDFFGENSSQLGVFWDFNLTTELPKKVQYTRNQASQGIKKPLKWSNTAYVNKWSFAFKITLCVFQVTKTQFCM